MHEHLHRCRHAAVPPLCCASFKVGGVDGTKSGELGKHMEAPTDNKAKKVHQQWSC